MSGSKLKFYKSIGPLLREWRRLHGISQEQFSETLGVSERQVRRWEASQHEVKRENLNDIAEHTRIPMPVLVALNADQPIYYSIKKRRYAYSASEPRYLIEPSTVPSLPDESGKIGHVEVIKSKKQIRAILDYDHDIYPTPKPVSEELIAASAYRLPELNLFCVDTAGHYAGHIVCFPLTQRAYILVRTQSISEGDLKAADLASPITSTASIFYVYSIYMCYSGFASLLMHQAFSYLLGHDRNPDSIVAGYAVTQDSIDLCQKLKMSEIFSSSDEYKALCTEVIPILFEGAVRSLRKAIIPGKHDPRTSG